MTLCQHLTYLFLERQIALQTVIRKTQHFSEAKKYLDIFSEMETLDDFVQLQSHVHFGSATKFGSIALSCFMQCEKKTNSLSYLCLDCHPSLPTVKSSKLPKRINESLFFSYLLKKVGHFKANKLICALVTLL